MAEESYAKVGHLKDVTAFAAHLHGLGVDLPCDAQVLSADAGSRSFRVGELYSSVLLGPDEEREEYIYVLVFDNGVGRGSWTPEQQARTLKELGYDGISYNYTTPEDLARWQKSFADVGLKIYGLYVHTYIDRPEAFDPRLGEAVAMLKGTPTVLWITVQKPTTASTTSDSAHDSDSANTSEAIPYTTT